MNTCSICFESENIDLWVTTSCDHIFCQLCIDKWLVRNNTCPCCRTPILDIDLNNEDDYDDMPPLINDNEEYNYQNNNIIHSANIYFSELDDFVINLIMNNEMIDNEIIHNEIIHNEMINNE